MAAVAFMKDFYVTLYEALKASKSWGARDLLACDVVAPRLKPAAGIRPASRLVTDQNLCARHSLPFMR